MKLVYVTDHYVTATKYNRPGEGSRTLELSCGHHVFRKASVKVPKKARCSQCRAV